MNPPTGQPPNRGMNRENYQHTMQEWRQDALSHRNEYQPQIEKQINSQFQNYSPPFYASVVGFRREWNLLVTKSRVSGYAATLGRELSDSETKAIAEHTLTNIHSNAACKWFTVGLAAYMTYRGRRTFQFPFYKPKPGGRFNPNEATSIFGNQKIRGFYPRATWHVVRFTAYVAVTMLMVDPVFRAVNFMQTQNSMTRDSRLEQFTKDVKSRVERVMSDGPATMTRRPHTNNDQTDSNGDQDSWSSTDSDASRDSFSNDESPYKDTPYVWEKAKQEASSAPGNQTSSGWGVSDDDDDDASPVASPTRTQPANSSGSAWDRIRRQSQPQQQPQQQFGGQSSYNRPQQGSQSQSSWDRTATSSNDYTFSRSDEERATAKEQAQLDFDRMLEQERRG